MKKYFFGVILILGCLLLMVIPKKTPEIIYEYLPSQEKMIVYYQNDNWLIGDVMAVVNEANYITEAFMYLTAKSNQSKYQTCLNLSSKLLGYEVKGKDIYLHINEDFFRIDENNTTHCLAQLLYTYQGLGYEKIYLLYNNEIIRQFGDYNLVNGIGNNLLVNIKISGFENEKKQVQIKYFYPDERESFTNYLIDMKTDELAFIISELLTFINDNYQTKMQIEGFQITGDKLLIKADADEEIIQIFSQMLNMNTSYEIVLV